MTDEIRSALYSKALDPTDEYVDALEARLASAYDGTDVQLGSGAGRPRRRGVTAAAIVVAVAGTTGVLVVAGDDRSGSVVDQPSPSSVLETTTPPTTATMTIDLTRPSPELDVTVIGTYSSRWVGPGDPSVEPPRFLAAPADGDRIAVYHRLSGHVDFLGLDGTELGGYPGAPPDDAGRPPETPASRLLIGPEDVIYLNEPAASTAADPRPRLVAYGPVDGRYVELASVQHDAGDSKMVLGPTGVSVQGQDEPVMRYVALDGHPSGDVLNVDLVSSTVVDGDVHVARGQRTWIVRYLGDRCADDTCTDIDPGPGDTMVLNDAPMAGDPDSDIKLTVLGEQARSWDTEWRYAGTVGGRLLMTHDDGTIFRVGLASPDGTAPSATPTTTLPPTAPPVTTPGSIVDLTQPSPPLPVNVLVSYPMPADLSSSGQWPGYLVETTPDGRIAVYEPAARRLRFLDQAGAPLAEYAVDGPPPTAESVGTYMVAVGPDDVMYAIVVDGDTPALVAYAPDGDTYREVARTFFGGGEATPRLAATGVWPFEDFMPYVDWEGKPSGLTLDDLDITKIVESVDRVVYARGRREWVIDFVYPEGTHCAGGLEANICDDPALGPDGTVVLTAFLGTTDPPGSRSKLLLLSDEIRAWDTDWTYAGRSGANLIVVRGSDTTFEVGAADVSG